MKNMKKSFRSKKAVSPVIATIIIVSIAIVMSIGVAYWMLSLGGAFTRFEKLEFVSGYADTDASGNFVVKMRVKNTGTAAATLDLVFLNGKPSIDYVPQITPVWANTTLAPGQDTSGTVTLIKGATWKSGMSVELMLQTVGGRQYPKTIILP